MDFPVVTVTSGHYPRVMFDEGGVRLEMLGRVTVRGPGGDRVSIARPQVAAVLAMCWDERRPVRREELAELLWGDWNFPEHWAGAVRGVITKSRQVLVEVGLPPEALRSEAGMVHLELPHDATTDLGVAEDLVSHATRALEAGDASSAEAAAREALSVLSQPLAITAEGDWPRLLQLRIDTFGRQAQRIIAASLLAQGRAMEAVAAGHEAVEADPLDEAAHEVLIEAHLAAGQPAVARRLHATFVDTMETELGVAPSARLSDLLTPVSVQPKRITPVVDRSRSEMFLGRSQELSTLQDRLSESSADRRPNLVVVTGPAGIGKTRLSEEFVARVGVTRMWGRCHPDAGEPFEPLAEAFRRLAEVAPHDDDATASATRRAVEAFDAQSSSLVATDGRGLRARMIHEVVQAVRTLCAAGPLVLVVDDLHWASGDTLGLLVRILEEADLPLLVVANARHEVAEPASLSELLRAAPSTVIDLETISARDLRPLTAELAQLVDEPLDVDLVAAQLWERTGGLPYYINEVVRDARRRNRFQVASIPEQVRSWVRNRIEALPDDLVSLAEVAAVIGPQPPVSLVAASWVGPDDQAVAGVERLMRAGLLCETDHGDSVAFAHQITREVIVDRISSPRVAKLHLRIAEVLLDDPQDPVPHAQVAQHLARSGAQHHLRAARHGYLAGVASLGRGAWDLADRQFDDALGSLDDAPVPLRAALLVAQGWTRHARGHANEAVALLNEATELARALELPHESARAALFLVGRAGRGAAHGMSDAERVARLRDALDAMRRFPVPSVDYDTSAFPLDEGALGLLQTAVEVELAWATLFTASLAERTELLTGTLQRANGANADPQRLARALLAQRNILAGPGRSDERLAVVEEVLELPRDALPAELVAYAHLQHHEELVLRADRDGARAALDAAHRAVANHVHPYWKWCAATWESLLVLIDGDPDAAETALAEAGMIPSDPSPEAAACGVVQLVSIRFAQRRADELVDLLEATAAAQPEIPCYGAVHALARSLAGDLAGAEIAYRDFADRAFENIPVDSNRLLTVAALGDVAATLDDEVGAKALDDLLAPDDDLFVVLNCYGGGGGWWGPVARTRARLADVLGCHDDARAARARAAELVDQFGAATLGQP